MCRHATHAAKLSDVIIFSSKLLCKNLFFHFKFKALKTIQCNTNHFYKKFKVLKLFSVNLLLISYCIFVAKIIRTYISTNVWVLKLSIFFQHSREITLSKIIDPRPNSNLNCLLLSFMYMSNLSWMCTIIGEILNGN
jgi:hypothetical protein